MNEYATYTCDVCGRSGNADDGVTGYGEPCPDPECPGATYPDDPKQDEYSYRELLSGLRMGAEQRLSRATAPQAWTLSDDELHVLLDAITYLELSLPTAKAPAGTAGVTTPWDDYT